VLADGYLRGVLVDGAEPFRHRGRVRTLLGLPEGAGTPIGFTRAPGLAAFEYLRERRYRPSVPVAPAVAHSVDLGVDPGGATVPDGWRGTSSSTAPAPQVSTADGVARAGGPVSPVVEVVFAGVRRPEREDVGAEPVRAARPEAARGRGDSGADDERQAGVRQGVQPARDRHRQELAVRSETTSQVQGTGRPTSIPTMSPGSAPTTEPGVSTNAPEVSVRRTAESTQDPFGSGLVREHGPRPVEPVETGPAAITPVERGRCAAGQSVRQGVRPDAAPGKPPLIGEAVTVTARPAPGELRAGRRSSAGTDDVAAPRHPDNIVIESPEPARRSSPPLSSVDTEVWVGDGKPASPPFPRYRREPEPAPEPEPPAPPQQRRQAQTRVVVVREESHPTQAFWERRHLGRLWAGVPR
jgi:hypothetical protein